MRNRVVTALIALSLAILPATAPVRATAGAWPREEGKTFLAFSYRISADSAALGNLASLATDGFSAIYLEYGARPRLTFGLDAGHEAGNRYSSIAFARWAIGPADARHRFAFSLGAGAGGPPIEPQLQAGLHWGHGFSTGWGDGWAGLDLSGIHRLNTGGTVAKADLTLGLKPADGWMTVLQLQAGSYPGDPTYLRIAPSVVRRLGRETYVEFGLDFDVLGSGNLGAKIGTWIEF